MGAPPPRRADGPRVIVIGAGAVGLFCAVEIARRGGAVTVIEADAAFPPNGPRAASHAAAGMLGPFSEVLHEGPGLNRRLGDLCHEGLKAWREVAARDAALARFVTFCGAVLLAYDDVDAARLRKACDRAHVHGEAGDMFETPPAEFPGHLYGDAVRACAHLPGEGVVAPSQMLQALAVRATMLGASIVRARAVTGVETRAGRVAAVRLDGDDLLHADIVVAAPGALGSEALASTFPALAHVAPAKGVLGGVRLLGALDTPEVVRASKGYFVRAGDEIRFGASMERGRADLDEDPAVLADMFAALRTILPNATFDGEPGHAGIGIRPLSPDGGPMVGANGPPGGFVAAGHGRNGWLLAPATGTALAASMFGEQVSAVWSAFLPNRFG